jgi:hypothetical protein
MLGERPILTSGSGWVHGGSSVPSPTRCPSCAEVSRGPLVCHGGGVELSPRHVAALAEERDEPSSPGSY